MTDPAATLTEDQLIRAHGGLERAEVTEDYPPSAWEVDEKPPPYPTTRDRPGTFRDRMARAGLTEQLQLEWNREEET